MNHELQKGDRVRVSDGTPQPPKHHKRKLAIWQMRNFDGYVWRVEPGRVAVDPTGSGMVVQVCHLNEVSVEPLTATEATT